MTPEEKRRRENESRKNAKRTRKKADYCCSEQLLFVFIRCLFSCFFFLFLHKFFELSIQLFLLSLFPPRKRNVEHGTELRVERDEANFFLLSLTGAAVPLRLSLPPTTFLKESFLFLVSFLPDIRPKWRGQPSSASFACTVKPLQRRKREWERIINSFSSSPSFISCYFPGCMRILKQSNK